MTFTIPKAPTVEVEFPSLGKTYQTRHITRSTIRLFHKWETGGGDAELVYELLGHLVADLGEEGLDQLPYVEAVAALRMIAKHTQEVMLALGKDDADLVAMAMAGASA